MKNALLSAANQTLIPLLERMMPANHNLAPVFIIGAPRSGSTLLFQVTTDYFDVAYLSNLHMRLWGAPALAEKLFNISQKHQPSDYQSQFGRVKGKTAPTEAARFFYRFFRRQPQYVPLEAADPSKMGALAQSVGALTNAAKKPVFFKNMHCALRLQPLARALPHALFVIIRRNLLDNAHSLLETRLKTWQDYETWWSMEPPAYDAISKLPAHQQVVEQIRDIYKCIESDRKAIGPQRFTEITYEDLTAAPSATMAKLETFFNSAGLFPKLRGVALPQHFSRRSEVRIDQNIFAKLEDYISGHS